MIQRDLCEHVLLVADIEDTTEPVKRSQLEQLLTAADALGSASDSLEGVVYLRLKLLHPLGVR